MKGGRWKNKYPKEYIAWSNMKQRCQNPKPKDKIDYVDKGICVCQRWQIFEYFIGDMGRAPTSDHTLERIDSTKGYDQFNCVWATKSDQANNRSMCINITIDGDTKTVAQWCDEKKIVGRYTAYNRIRRGWDPVRAVLTKPRPITRASLS